MTIRALLAQMKEARPPALAPVVLALESALGERLPEDYREFLIASNGGSLGGRFWFFKAGSATPETAPHHIGGFRPEAHFSLLAQRLAYQDRIPVELLWIMDDSFGNAICLGTGEAHRGKVYFWDHKDAPALEEWDGTTETAKSIALLAESFTQFVEGLRAGGEV